MKSILTFIFSLTMISNVFADPVTFCSLPLCEKINSDRALFRGIDNFKFPKYEFYNFSKSKIKKNSVRKITFERSKPIKKRVRKKLLWPLKRGKISSKFGYRKSPFTGKRHYHHGLDIATKKGSRFRASGSGVVIKSGWYRNGCGLGITISHGKFETVYCHASKLFVKTGDKVKRGKVIGLVGSTGLSTGPHLHFEIRKNNKAYNPLNLLG
mgnify:CR=1 FL=1